MHVRALPDRVSIKLNTVFKNGIKVFLDIADLLESISVFALAVESFATLNLKPEGLHLMNIKVAEVHVSGELYHHIVRFLDFVFLKEVL